MDSNHKYLLSIAPMLDITDHHFRSFIRLITKHTLLYTEMINADAINHSTQDLLKFDQDQLPLVLQFGGNDPNNLQLAGIKAKSYNYTEYNFNCGCPSPKVVTKEFGASLMSKPDLVKNCVKSLGEINYTSIKCRIGLNSYDKKFLREFMDKTKEFTQKYIIHSRVAIMGIDTIKNRTVPELMPEIAYELMNEYNGKIFVLNGGIKTLEEVKEHNSKGMCCMIGRAAYDNPWLFKEADKTIFNKISPILNKTRKDIIYEYSDYCENYINKYNGEMNNILISKMIKPLTNLFNGEKNSKKFREELYKIPIAIKKENDYHNIKEHFYTLIEEFSKINPEAVNN